MVSISKQKLEKLFQIRLSNPYLIEKQKLSVFCTYFGFLLLYFGSLHPWFLWSLKELYVIPAVGMLTLGYLVSNSSSYRLFTRTDFLIPIHVYSLLIFYIAFRADSNINGYITALTSIAAFFALFRFDKKWLQRFITFTCKSMAVLLAPSLCLFFLYIIGFGLPSRNAVFGDGQYSYNNFFFFMVDDRFLSDLIPRFQSVFLEPGHLGSATTMLLFTQMGRWKKWYNIILIVATLASFSLTAYVLIVAIMFAKLWVDRKKIVGKVVILLTFFGVIAGVASVYNDGDNLVNNLILARLEVDEKSGDIVGNNRVSAEFEVEFDKYITTTDAFFGRDMSRIPSGTGNSGYRVFIYQNGLVGLLLVILLYGFSFRDYKDIRYLMAVVFISLLVFWNRGYPLWYSNFIPLLATVFQYNKLLISRCAK